VALIRIDVSEERSASIIRVTIIGELGATLAVTSVSSARRLLVTANVVPSSPVLVTLMTETRCSSETSVLTIATGHTFQKAALFSVQFFTLLGGRADFLLRFVWSRVSGLMRWIRQRVCARFCSNFGKIWTETAVIRQAFERRSQISPRSKKARRVKSNVEYVRNLL
jgi:hypothetical protein